MEGVRGLGRTEKQPAGLGKDAGPVEILRKALEDLEALLDEADADLVGVVLTHEGSRIARGAGADPALLQQDHVSQPLRGQVMQYARPKGASTDDYRVGRLAHRDASLSPMWAPNRPAGIEGVAPQPLDARQIIDPLASLS